MQRLQDISTQLIESGNVEALYQHLLDTAIDLMGSDFGSMQLFCPEQGELRLLAYRGFSSAAAAYWQWVRPDSGSACAEALRTGRRVIVPDMEQCAFAGGHDLALWRELGIRSVQTTPLLSRSGLLLGMISTHWRLPHRPAEPDLHVLDVLARQAADLIEQAQTEGALRESEQRLRLALRAGRLGDWHLKLMTMELTCSDACKAIFGRAPHEPLTYEMLRGAIHPDDRARVDALVRPAIEQMAEYEVEYRCIWPDGSTHWISDRGVACGGHDAHMVGVVLDITGRRRAEAEIRESEGRFRAMADYAPVLIWVNGLAGCEFVNRSYLDFLGVTMDEVLGMGWTRFVHPDDHDAYVQGYIAAAEQQAAFEGELRFRRADGTYRRMRTVGVPRTSAVGEFLGYVGSTYDITDLKLAEAALQEADRRKNEFLAMLAHELRNPLAPIRNALQILRLKEGSREVVHYASETIERQIRQLVRLVDDLLDVSRITQGRIEIRSQRVDLAFILGQAIEAARPLSDSMGHELTLVLPSEPVPLDGDPVRLTQVFANLLDNACKYMPTPGHIRMTVELSTPDGRLGHVTVRIKDEGIGIPSDQLTRIFEMFTQVDNSLERSQTGLGIGLSLVKTVVGMHGGSVEAQSDGPGQGSVFVVELPLAVTPATASNVKPVVAPRATRARRILVVDDNRDSARSLAFWLKAAGHDTRAAYDGVEALELAASDRPDIVLLDLGIPRLNGYDVCRRIREQPWGQNMVLIAQTGWGQDEDKRRTEAAGFDGHLVKPVDPDALMQLLERTDGGRAD